MPSPRPTSSRSKSKAVAVPDPKGPRKIVTAAAWKTVSISTSEVELELPSGNVVLAKKPALAELLSSGMLPDMLTSQVNDQIDKAEGRAVKEKEELSVAKIMKEKGPEGLSEMLESFDRIAAYCVKQPNLQFHKEMDDDGQWVLIDPEDRDEDAVYTDEVDFEDKSFIGSWAMGGQAELTPFREEAS